MNSTVKLPPQDLVAERSVIGSVLLNPEMFDEVSPILQVDDFYLDAHQMIWSAISEMVSKGLPVDPVTLATSMATSGSFSDIGGVAGIRAFLDEVPHAMHAQHYARTVRDMSRRRSLQYLASDIAAATDDLTEDVESLISRVEQQFFDLSDARSTVRLKTLREVVTKTIAEFNDHADTADGLRTGFGQLDESIGGLRPGNLIIVAARPGCGKSALLQNVINNIACHDTATLLVSLEMSDGELAERMLSEKSGVEYQAIRRRQIYLDSEYDALFASGGDLCNYQLWIDDASTRTVSQIAACARLLKRRDNLGLLVVDYLQLISPDDRKMPREQQVATMTRSLKRLAKDLEIPIILAAQLNREVEKREGGKPKLSDLRESGAIEQDADVVVFIHRPGQSDPKADQSEATLLIRKARGGMTRDIDLVCDLSVMRFREKAPEHLVNQDPFFNQNAVLN